MNKKSHSEILKELMEAKNIKAAQLARMADLPPTTIYSMLKRNNRNTEPETLAKISKDLNIHQIFTTCFLIRDFLSSMFVIFFKPLDLFILRKH